jgi:hypothetical protein
MSKTTATVHFCDPSEDGFHVFFGYTVDGEHFSGELISQEPLEKDQDFSLWYDANDPRNNEFSDSEDVHLIYRIVLIAAGIVVLCVGGITLTLYFLK